MKKLAALSWVSLLAIVAVGLIFILNRPPISPSSQLAQVSAGNLTGNPSYEDGTAGNADTWEESSSHERASDRAHSGTYSLKSTYRSSGGAGVNTNQTVSVSPNTTYTYSGWIYKAATSGAAYLDMNDISGELSLSVTQTNSWQKVSGTWNSGSNTSVQLRMVTDGALNGDVWFDDIEFVAGAASSPPPPPPPIAPPPPPPPSSSTSSTVLEAENMATKTTGAGISGGWNIYSNGYIGNTANFPSTATYSFTVRAYGSYAGGAWPEMEVLADNLSVGRVTVNSSEYKDYVFSKSITSGNHLVKVAFLNDYYLPPADRNLYVDKVTIAGASQTTAASSPVPALTPLPAPPLPSPPPEAPPPSSATGERIRLIELENVFVGPGIATGYLGLQQAGALGTRTGSCQAGEGWRWCPVNWDSGADGWVLEHKLQAVTTSTPPPPPLAPPVPTLSPLLTPPPLLPLPPPPVVSTKFQIDSSVQTTSTLNVRNTANGTLLGTQALGARGIVVEGPVNSGGYNWWNIDYATGADGWSAENYLVIAPTFSPALLLAPQAVTLSGIFYSSHIDDFKNRTQKKVYALLANGKFYNLNLQSDPQIISGTPVRVSGSELNNVIVPSYLQATASPPTASINIQGDNLLLLLVQFQDSPAAPFSQSQIENEFSTGSFNQFFQEQSYSKKSWNVTATNWITLPYSAAELNWETGGRGIWQVAGEAVKMARGNLNLQVYDQILIMYNVSPEQIFYASGYAFGRAFLDFGYAGPLAVTHAIDYLTPLFSSPNKTTSALDYVAMHEVGHDMQSPWLPHANFLDCTGFSFPLPPSSNNIGCTHLEYGNVYDAMGSWGWKSLHFNAQFKESLGWLDNSSTITVSKSGIYSLSPYELPVGFRALKIPSNLTSGRESYYAEYRTAKGFDAHLSPKDEGLVITLQDPNMYWGGNYLIDATAPMQNIWGSYINGQWEEGQVSLHSGEVYSDPSRGVKIGPVISMDPSQITFEVCLNDCMSLSASPRGGLAGDPVTLSWYSSSGSRCTASSSNFSWSGVKSNTGSEVIYPQEQGTYTLACTKNGITTTKSVIVKLFL